MIRRKKKKKFQWLLQTLPNRLPAASKLLVLGISMTAFAVVRRSLSPFAAAKDVVLNVKMMIIVEAFGNSDADNR